MLICGIDYGSKLAGTTVIAALSTSAGSIQLTSTQKNEDADKVIYQSIGRTTPALAFIDAPLSLPGVYTQPQYYNDYFFRQADKQLQAMSPMFLGGLTARAMKLKAELQAISVSVVETYPAAQAARIGLLHLGYKKDISAIPVVVHRLMQHLAPFIRQESVVTNWHQVDALLALLSGIRFINNEHQVFGDALEGVIII